MKKWLLLIITVVILALSFAGWQTIQLAKAKQQINTNAQKLSRDMAVNSFRLQYGQVIDKISVQAIDTNQATIVYWTENVTAGGKITLHASAVINGVVLEFPKTQDVTEYMK